MDWTIFHEAAGTRFMRSAGEARSSHFFAKACRVGQFSFDVPVNADRTRVAREIHQPL
jgi:hypothetical protein